jgi:hypothetical protein
MIHRAVLLCTLFLAACAPMAWNKPGASQSDFSADRYDCMQQAQQRVSGAYVNSAGGVASNQVITNPNLFASCMNAKGWYLSRQASTQQQAQQMPDPFKETMDQLNREIQENCVRDEYKPYYAKTACKPEDISLEQLSDTSKISEIEKPVLSKLRSAGQTVNRRAQEAFRTYKGEKGTAIASALERSNARADKITLDLYQGSITWGEYNSRRKEAVQTYRDDFNQVVRGK